jgi:hypothetical protein
MNRVTRLATEFDFVDRPYDVVQVSRIATEKGRTCVGGGTCESFLEMAVERVIRGSLQSGQHIIVYMQPSCDYVRIKPRQVLVLRSDFGRFRGLPEFVPITVQHTPAIPATAPKGPAEPLRDPAPQR